MDKAAALRCLKEVDFARIRTAAYAMKDDFKYTTRTFNWGPVIDGTFLRETLTEAVSGGRIDIDVAWATFNQHEGETFVPPGLRTANSTTAGGGYNSSEASFDGWLRGYLPGFTDADIADVKALYPGVGSTDTAAYGTTYERAGAIYRDSVLSCAGFWVAGAARRAGYLSEYARLPATHADDTKWVSGCLVSSLALRESVCVFVWMLTAM
ncbi:hypothetical protein EJ05DRAFT_476959 [Pseudovirgaria hyperparasitica]|uniref:Uncharacterized protein n=1 Tax=Pseudovirgaria hyperparasitica TaxID=470096 RepID=A0A6A6W489_9PEZI|nr:uncharacterized protein EJ05DRAFT_476959 [Pseudovirgaria hyperparasitica]KAF2757748.1 hypothetical protein EJ05DRAFT_476959 [Pseudovirgaria hyperparasitica]